MWIPFLLVGGAIVYFYRANFLAKAQSLESSIKSQFGQFGSTGSANPSAQSQPINVQINPAIFGRSLLSKSLTPSPVSNPANASLLGKRL